MSEALEPFPEIVSLGRDVLQRLCNEWAAGMQAREFGVASVTVTPDCLNLQPAFLLHANNYGKGETLHFPFDLVLEFIIDNGINEGDRSRLKERLLELRRRAGVTVFQRYAVNIRGYTMALRCPDCSHLMLTQYRVFHGQEFKLDWADPVKCPRCSHTFPVSVEDFFPVIDPDSTG